MIIFKANSLIAESAAKVLILFDILSLDHRWESAFTEFLRVQGAEFGKPLIFAL